MTRQLFTRFSYIPLFSLLFLEAFLCFQGSMNVNAKTGLFPILKNKKAALNMSREEVAKMMELLDETIK